MLIIKLLETLFVFLRKGPDPKPNTIVNNYYIKQCSGHCHDKKGEH